MPCWPGAGPRSGQRGEQGTVYRLELSTRALVHEPMLKRPQRGLSLLAFVFWLAWAGICLYASILFIPVLNEYGAVQRAVRKIATSGATTRFEVQSAFDRQKRIDQIESISGKDLKITQEGNELVISFSYDRPVLKVGNAVLMVRISDSSRAPGRTY